MNIVDKFNEARRELFEHVGFVEGWVIYPVSCHSDSFWRVEGENIKYADSIEQFNSDGDYYEDEISKQRFYKEWIYKGKDYTMIFCDPHVDGCKWFRVFDNSKMVF